MNVLILGGGGMLGHKTFAALGADGRHPHGAPSPIVTHATFRQTAPDAPGGGGHAAFAGADPSRLIHGVDALDLASVERALDRVTPDAVINCVAIVKQREAARLPIPSIRVNALFPHQLADLCAARGIRLIHLSTDCVFSGRRGHYTEDDNPDPVDLYGRTKLLGELDRPGCLTLRTSIIGWELVHRASLLEWFASQRGATIQGYRRVIWSGLPSAVLTEVIRDLLLHHPRLEGLYQVASTPLTKYDLLVRLRDALGWTDIAIEPYDAIASDPSLVGQRFEQATGWRAPSWDTMIDGLAAEWPTYAAWRSAA
ncbi:MAG: SDR family oxidoreductase [Acidobacteriota bacterium]